jgi:hypothetical protein
LRDGGNVGGQSLSTVHIAEQWRMQKTTKEKEKGKGKSNAAVGTTEAVVKGSCSPLMDDGPSFFLCFYSSPSLFLAASCLQNKQSRNVALRKACRNSFYKTDF